ncbi:MAG: hypothetical protein QG597_4718 [Actinomycetota bacterium]|nr:hypothetical protein [Actinomycetota bacterium]
MPLLFNSFDFPALSRMTGIWTNSTHDPDAGDDVTLAQLVVLPPDQDPVVESDFMCSHLPFHVGGFHGVFPDGQGWMVVLQKAPASASLVQMAASDPHWALVDSIQRALRFNYGAKALDFADLTPDFLVRYCIGAGADADVIADWTVTELLWGLLAECCNVSLAEVAAGYQEGCAFPDRDHECQGNVFRDVFAMWTTRALSGHEPDLDEVYGDVDDSEFERWTRKKLKKIKRGELVRMAVADGWDWSDVADVPKELLMRLMVDGQTRPPGTP